MYEAKEDSEARQYGSLQLPSTHQNNLHGIEQRSCDWLTPVFGLTL
jgi:hypothetical protein